MKNKCEMFTFVLDKNGKTQIDTYKNYTKSHIYTHKIDRLKTWRLYVPEIIYK